MLLLVENHRTETACPVFDEAKNVVSVMVVSKERAKSTIPEYKLSFSQDLIKGA